MKNKILILLIIFFMVYGCSKSLRGTSIICLDNRSSDEINFGLLKICNNQFKIDRLKTKNRICFNFTPCSDNTYFVEVQFLSGKKLKKSTGYITKGVNYRDRLIVQDEDIIFQRDSIE